MKSAFVFILAVLAGLIASYMTHRFLPGDDEKHAQKDTIEVIVAKAKLNQWTPIRKPDELFENRRILEKEAPANAVRSLDELKNKVLLKSIKKGQVITRECLLDREKAGMDAQITPNKRAFSLKAAPDTCVGGFIMPGHYVDVIHVTKKEGKTPFACYALQNVLVRAVNQETTVPDDKISIAAPVTITLELDPGQVLTLAQVLEHGTVRLALRSFGDDKRLDDKDPLELVSPPPPPPPPVRPPVRPNPDQPRPPDDKGAEKTVKVFVAKKDFNQWSPIRNPEEMFAEKEVPFSKAPKNAVSNSESLNKFILLKSIKKGEVLCKDFLLAKEKSGIDASIPKGKRLISIKTTDASTNGAFVLPGTYVDVVRVVKKEDKTKAEYVLRNVPVRAVQLNNEKPKGNGEDTSTTVTLEVTPEQALKLAEMKNETFTLLLRPFGDDDEKKEEIPVPAPPK